MRAWGLDVSKNQLWQRGRLRGIFSVAGWDEKNGDLSGKMGRTDQRRPFRALTDSNIRPTTHEFASCLLASFCVPSGWVAKLPPIVAMAISCTMNKSS